MSLDSDLFNKNLTQIENLCLKSKEILNQKNSDSNKTIISYIEQIKQLSDDLIKASEAKTEISSSIPDLSSKKILIVEDNSVNLMVAQAFLKKTGCTTFTAENGKEALDKIYSTPFDLVFMDIQMPVMTGLEAIKELRKESNPEKLRKLPVLAMTGNVLEEDLKKAVSEGFTDYITKPVAAAILYEKCALYTSVEKTVTVEKTAAKPKTVSENKNCSSYPDFSNRKILVVDDNKLNVEIINLMVKKTGAVFENAFDGQEALDKYLSSEENTFDLILLDIQMPVMDGNTCAEKIRASGRADSRVPIIAISANAFQEDKDKSLKAGINFHMSKPVNMKSLHEKMSELLS